MFSLGAKRNTSSGRQSEAQHQPHRDTHKKIKETYDVYRKSISSRQLTVVGLKAAAKT